MMKYAGPYVVTSVTKRSRSGSGNLRGSRGFFVAVRARLARYILRRGLLVDRKRVLAGIAESRCRFLQVGIDVCPLIENEAIAFVMRLAAIFEIFQDTPIKLVNLIETILR